MSLVALDGTPLVAVGGCGGTGTMRLSGLNGITADAANEAWIYVGQIVTEDGGSHTIDTTGSSAFGWRSGSSTFANAGTSVSVGLAAVDTGTGPPARAVNVADVITFDVAAVLTGGGGGIASNNWNSNVPTTGTKTVANGDLVAFAVQMTARGGIDSISNQVLSVPVNTVRPAVTAFTGGSYVNQQAVPNVLITFSDGVKGHFWGDALIFNDITTQTWNSGSGTKEYGNYFLMPVPTKIYGFMTNITISGDLDLVLYSDPLGTPVAEKTISVDANTVGASAASLWEVFLFPSPFTATASQPLAGIMKPGASNISAPYIGMNSASDMTAWTLGTNCYAVNRASGAFAAQNSNKDRFGLALLVGAFSNGVAAVVPTPVMHLSNTRYRDRLVGY